MMENFAENYQLCQLARDDSFGWPLQDPDLEADPFNPPAQDLNLSVFDLEPMEWNKPWPLKNEQSAVPESAWQQLAISLKAPPTLSGRSTSLTPVLAALDFPKSPTLPAELDSSALGSVRSTEGFAQRHGGYLSSPRDYRCPEPQQPEYRQTGDLGSATYVVQQPVGSENVITIGIYTRAERAAKIHRFRQKRERRNFTKRVLYGCRKQFADSRPRVGGRFVINENRVIKPKTFLKRGRPRKVPLLPMINCLATNFLSN